MSYQSSDDALDEHAPASSDAGVLKQLVVQATSCIKGEGDAAAVVQLTEFVQGKPELLRDCLHMLKCRVKGKDGNVVVISMGLVDQVMKAHGWEAHKQVAQMILPRVTKLASPNTSTPSTVRHKAATLVHQWGASYGRESGLEAFAEADEGLQEKERRVLYVASEVADRPPQNASQTQQRPPMPRGSSFRQLLVSDNEMPGIERMGSFGQGGRFDTGKVEEAIRCLEEMMLDADPISARVDTVMASAALTCKKLQVLCVQHISKIGEKECDEGRVAEVLELNDRLSHQVAVYEQLVAIGNRRTLRMQRSRQSSCSASRERPAPSPAASGMGTPEFDSGSPCSASGSVRAHSPGIGMPTLSLPGSMTPERYSPKHRGSAMSSPAASSPAARSPSPAQAGAKYGGGRGRGFVRVLHPVYGDSVDDDDEMAGAGMRSRSQDKEEEELRRAIEESLRSFEAGEAAGAGGRFGDSDDDEDAEALAGARLAS